MTDSLTVRVDGLSLRLNGVAVLSEVTFHVKSGEMVGLVGANGAGKTSVANVLSGYYRPSAGVALVAGGPPGIRRSGGGRVRRSFQNVPDLAGLRAVDLVTVGIEADWRTSLVRSYAGTIGSRRAERAAHERALGLLDAAGLASISDRPLMDCPYGVRKLVDVVRTFASQDTDLVILDEPTSGVADSEREHIRDLILRLVQSSRVASMLVIDHDIGFVRSLCHRLVAMEAGGVLAEGSADQVLGDPRVIASFVGPGLGSNRTAGRPTSGRK